VTPEAQHPCRNGEFEAEQHGEKEEQQPYAPEALSGKPQHPAKVKEPPKQQGLDHNAPAREDKCSYEDRWGEEAIGLEQAHKRAAGPARWFCKGRHELRGEGSRSVLAVRHRIRCEGPGYWASPAHADKNRTLQEELLLTV
jgi:hypothetical protein